MLTVKTINVIYDRKCGFCVRVLRIVRALDLLGALRFYDAHRPETFAHLPALSGADLNDAMYAVVAGEPVYRGFYAFRRMIWSSPLAWVLIPLFYFPTASFLGPRLYAWVARNRSKFGCRSELCALQPDLQIKQLRDDGRSMQL